MKDVKLPSEGHYRAVLTVGIIPEQGQYPTQNCPGLDINKKLLMVRSEMEEGEVKRGLTEGGAIPKQSLRLPQRASGECFEYTI
jgi:hypothetical protein